MRLLLVLAGVGGVAVLAATGALGVTGTDKITTVAGISKFGQGGYSGDGGPATRALLWNPKGVAVDAQGNIYIADSRNHRVRKVIPSGKITTIAGIGRDGIPGAGDGGPATSAPLGNPRGVAVDAQRNIFIADEGRVSKVSPNGTITTFAGGPCRGISLSSCPLGDGGSATLAWLVEPHGVGVDAQGNVYIAEYAGHRVRKVSPNGTITTIAGTGKSGFSGDGGPATSARLYGPAGVVVDAKRNVYIADELNGLVRKVSPNGTITTFAGNRKSQKYGDGPATKMRLGTVFGLAVDKAGILYIAGASPARIMKVSGGKLTRVAGRDPYGRSGGIGEGGPATSAQMASPFGVAVDGKGNLYVVDAAYNTVRKVWNGRRAR